MSASTLKSGSLFECAPEKGFSCKLYAGNGKNHMNLATSVESPSHGLTTYDTST